MLSGSALSAIVLIIVNVLVFSDLRHVAKQRLRTVAASIQREMADASMGGQPIPADLAASINAKLAFADDGDLVSYALYRPDGTPAYRSPGFDIHPNLSPRHDDHSHLSLYRVESGRRLSRLLSVWRFVLRRDIDGYVLYVSEGFTFELAELLAISLGIALGLSLLLAFLLGYLFSRRFLRPLAAIRDGFQSVRVGHLGARIPHTEMDREVRELTDAINVTLADLEESFQRIEQFSVSAAHELSTPLTVLRGNLEVCLGEERSPGEYQEVLAEGIEEATALSNMIRDLLMMTTGKRCQGDFTMFEAGSALRDVLDRLAPVAAQHDVQIEVDVSDAIDLIGDPTLFSRMCYNLVHNSIRFSPAGSTVSASLHTDGQAIIFTVTDQGIGIAREHQTRVFDRFYQVDASRRRGSGLGLAMVKWIVGLHNGRINVTSELGNGACFRIWLPTMPPC
jgi:signal transduction histidine kinase